MMLGLCKRLKSGNRFSLFKKEMGGVGGVL